MVIHAERNPEEIFGKNPLCNSSLPVGSPDLTEHSFIHSAELETTIALISRDTRGKGEWICGTDLMQMESGKNRPRLLPQGVKMMFFIENDSKKTANCPAWSNNYMTSNITQREDLWSRKGLYNIYGKTKKQKQFSEIPPKKRFLKRFIQEQDCC